MPPTPKKTSGKMYLWTEYRNGGEGELQNIAGGKDSRYVITKRNIHKADSEVTKDDLGVDDEEWDNLVERGVVRPYPRPEGTDDYTSPTQAFLAQYSTGTGEVDIDKVMELGLSHPNIVPGESEPSEEVPVGA